MAVAERAPPAAAAILAASVLLAACASYPAAPIAQPSPSAPSQALSSPGAAPPTLSASAPALAAVEPAAAPRAERADPTPVNKEGEPRTLAHYLKGLRDASCPTSVTFQAPKTIGLKARRVPLSGLNPGRKKIGKLSFVAGFHLTSDDKRFGGLSDLHFLPDGNLISVSDEGHFVWIDLGKDGVTPVAARLSDMLDVDGKLLDGKGEADSEGVAVNDGVALVSFERDHRILAYDLQHCGAAARGAPIVYGGYSRKMTDVFAQEHITVPDNTSLEALAVTPDWFVFSGLEQQVDHSGPLSARPIEAPPEFTLRIEKNAPDFVALDLLPAEAPQPDPHGEGWSKVRAFTLHRGVPTLLDNAIVISESGLERDYDQNNLPRDRIPEIDNRARWRWRVTETHRLAEMNLTVTIDNFEGIAAKRLPDGAIRLFVVSDDNYSAAQRTLLMIYDLPPGE